MIVFFFGQNPKTETKISKELVLPKDINDNNTSLFPENLANIAIVIEIYKLLISYSLLTLTVQ